MPLLRTEDLSRSFGRLAATASVNFSVERGELRSIIGPNGAGKTTFFRLIAGELPPSAGRIFFKERDITGWPQHRICRLGIGRTEQDEWSVRSHQLAAEAARSGRFADEIVPLQVAQRKGDPIPVDSDEGIRKDATVESLAVLEPAFVPGGTITAGNASQISDGAAALVVADRVAAEASGAPIIGEILAYGQIGGSDATLHERPAEALLVALKKAGLDPTDLDLVEINEAFAAVSIWAARMLDIPESKVNVHGGGVALGHPLGATGARIVVTLINALRARGGGVGAATLCGGGGQGDAIVIRVDG